MGKLEITSVPAAELPSVARPRALNDDDEALVAAVIAAASSGENAAVSPMLTDAKNKPLTSKAVTSAGARIKRLVSKRLNGSGIASARTIAKDTGFAWVITIKPSDVASAETPAPADAAAEAASA